MADIAALVSGWREEGIRWVRFEAPDMHGTARSKLIPIEEVPRYAAEGLNVYGGNLVLDSRSDVVGGSLYHEEINYADQLYHPDPDTAAVVPWADRTARLICNSSWYDGTEMEAAPRNVLRRVLDRLAAAGHEAFMGQENEFYLLDPETLQPAFFDGYHIFNTLRNEYHPVIRDILEHLPAFGLDIITANCEYGPSQWEINHGPKAGLAAADATYTFKNSVKELAHRHGLLATFMSKPFSDAAGCGAHTHVSLRDPDSGRNMFADEHDALGLSQLARHFIAGNLAHASAVYALLAPTVNCLKRRRRHTFSPTNISWGVEDRSAMLRVKLGSVESRHVEHRAPTGLSNPYLVMAAVLAAGLLGIENKLDPGAPSEAGVPAEDDPRFSALPTHLHAGLDALEQADDLRELLGDEFVRIYTTVRRYELARFEDHVTDWEREEYARVY